MICYIITGSHKEKLLRYIGLERYVNDVHFVFLQLICGIRVLAFVMGFAFEQSSRFQDGMASRCSYLMLSFPPRSCYCKLDFVNAWYLSQITSRHCSLSLMWVLICVFFMCLLGSVSFL